MGRGILKENEVELLKDNPFVVDVNKRRIIYSLSFKKRFMEEYEGGKGPTQIFIDAGFDPKILGTKRIERAAARWKESWKSGTLG